MKDARKLTVIFKNEGSWFGSKKISFDSYMRVRSKSRTTRLPKRRRRRMCGGQIVIP